MATQTQDQSLVHRELARQAQNIHRVRNPRDIDYQLMWDGYVERIPAHSTADIQTYKMDKYLREMKDVIIRERLQKEVDDENKRRRDRGEKEMEKWTGEAQHILESKIMTEMNSPESTLKIYKELYVGLVKEYGVDTVERERVETVPTTHEQIMDKLLSSRTPVSPVEAPIMTESITDTPQTPLAQLNQAQLRKMAREKGLETQKTDKKDELINRISQTEEGDKDDQD